MFFWGVLGTGEILFGENVSWNILEYLEKSETMMGDNWLIWLISQKNIPPTVDPVCAMPPEQVAI